MSGDTGARADLHVHSKYSDRPSEWFLRRIGAPESFVEPQSLYERCIERGMDFVTISDHNCIRGALEIAHLPRTFLSSEITTYFPEDGCKVHCLVNGITEEWFRQIQQLRPNIYELQKYLLQEGIVHAIAHPLFRVNDRLTIDHFEKLILMFKRFEGINGTRDPRACVLANTVFENLTPECINELANKHNIEPAGPEPWKKFLTGGSDDHSGLYATSAHTVTDPAPTVLDFLQHMRMGRHQPAGNGGTSLRLAHSLYQIAYSYYKHHFMRGQSKDHSLVGAMLRNLAGEPQVVQKSGLRAAILRPFVKAYQKRKLNEIERMIVDEFTLILNTGDPVFDAGTAGAVPEDPASRHFRAACKISQRLSLAFLTKFTDQLRRGNLIESIQAISSMGPVFLGIAPYFTAFGAQRKDESFLREVASRFPSAHHLRERSGRKAWVTDTFTDINGVAHTINMLSSLAAQTGSKDITVVTGVEEDPKVDYPLHNFKPIGTFTIPEYESQLLAFPPFLEILAYFEEREFDEIIISTPGPMGLCALGAARLLGIDVKGIYHTDFPKYIEQWTDDTNMEEMTWRYMRWFYGDMHTVFVPTRAYLNKLTERGFERERLVILPRGVDRELFSPARRKEDYWKTHGLNGRFKFIYVGRVSSEKNVRAMLDAFVANADKGNELDLIVVGDGPALKELRAEYDRQDIVFTGYLKGEQLATAYASADAFIFPSMTDTFGNAVLEAHASGLPAIVSDKGGPAELVQTHESGLIVDARQPSCLADAMRRMSTESDLYARLREGALAKANESSWESALDLL